MPMRVIGVYGLLPLELRRDFSALERTWGEQIGVCYRFCYRIFPIASLIALAALLSSLLNMCA